MSVVVSSAAFADLQRLHEFLSDRNPAAARRAAAVLIAAIDSLAAFPERGRPFGASDTRELIVPFGGSAYILRYAHLADRNETVVLRIWHGREMRDL